MLHLYAGAVARRTPLKMDNDKCKPLAAVYIPVPSPFPVLETFIDEVAKAYNLDLFHCPHLTGPQYPVESVTQPGTPANGLALGSADGKQKGYMDARPANKAKGGEGMKVALVLYKEKFPHVDAILIGTRRTDPHGGTANTSHCGSL